MKLIYLILFSLLTNDCTPRKAQILSSETFAGDTYIGIIHLADDGCPFYIEIPEALNPGREITFTKVFPLNLKDGMKKKGLKVKFDYTLSKSMNPEGCNADAVIQIGQICVIP